MTEFSNQEQGSQEKPPKKLNIHWLATHLLPIFLVLILGSAITIASVPSFRTSFNNFIAKWSPKADTNVCGPTTEQDTLVTGIAGITASPIKTSLGNSITVNINNYQKPVYSQANGRWWTNGLYDLTIFDMPRFNKDGFQFKADGTLDKTKKISITGAGRDGVAYYFTRNWKYGAWENKDPNNDDKSVYVKNPNDADLPENFWFNGILWRATPFDIPDESKVVGADDGLLIDGAYGATFTPIKATNGWQWIGYNLSSNSSGNMWMRGYSIHTSYAVYVDAIKVNQTPEENEVILTEKDNSLSGSTKLNIESLNNSQPFSTTVMVKSNDNSKIKISGEGVSGPDQDGWWSFATDVGGKKTVNVESTSLGKFTFTAKGKDACAESTYDTQIEFVKAKGKISIAKEDYIPDENNNLVLTIPRNIATATTQAIKIKSDNSEEALADRKVKVTFPLDGSKISTNKNAVEADWMDATKGLELTTDGNGTGTVYIKSGKTGDGKKAKLDDSDGKFTAESDYGIKFTAPELVAPTFKSQQIEYSDEQEKIFNDIVSVEEEAEITNEKKSSWLRSIKTKVVSLLGLGKAYSEDSECKTCVLGNKKLYPGNKVNITLEIKNNFGIELNNFEVFADIPNYFSVVTKPADATWSQKDADTWRLIWNIDKLGVGETKTLSVFTLKLLSENLPQDGKLSVNTGSRKGEKYENGAAWTPEVYWFKDSTKISIEKIVRDGKEYAKADIARDAEGKEKIYPGDKIYYQLTYQNNTELELKDVDLFTKVSAQAEEWTCKLLDCGENIESDETNKLIIWHFDSVAKHSEITKTYFVKLKDDIPSDAKTVGTWAAIGDKEYKEIYYKDISDVVWLKYNLWGKISGQILAVDDQSLPGVTTGLLTKDHPLPSFEAEVAHSRQATLRNVTTDQEGKFSLEFNRQKDFHDSQKYKLSVSFFSERQNEQKDRKTSLRTGELESKDILHFRTAELDLPTRKNQEQNIRIGRGGSTDPLLEYPTNSTYLDQIAMGSLIYRNLYQALNYSIIPYNLNLPDEELVIKFMPKGEDYPSYYKDNTIFLNENVWRDRSPENRGNAEELHEFGHFLLDKIGLKAEEATAGENTTPNLDVPYVSESAGGQCGRASTAVIYNYLAQENKQCAERFGASWPQVLNQIYLQDNVGFKQVPEYDSQFSTGVWQDPNFTSQEQFETIIESLKLGYPVIMFSDLYAESNGIGHIFVLTGYYYDENNTLVFRANNPLVGGDDNEKNVDTINGVKLTKDNIWLRKNHRQEGALFININLDYARKYPLTERALQIADPDLSYLNTTSSNSLVEGLSSFIATDLDNRISSSTRWYYTNPDGTVEYDLKEIHPAFVNYGDLYSTNKIQGGEGWVVASSMVALNEGLLGSYQNSNFRWTRFKDSDKYQSYNLNFPSSSAVSIEQIFALLQELAGKDNKNIWGWYNVLKNHQIGQNGVNEIGLNYLDQLFVLYGFYKDRDFDWLYDPGEVVGKTANSDTFTASYAQQNIAQAENTIKSPTLISSPYVQLLKNTATSQGEKSSYRISVPTIISQIKQTDKIFPNRADYPNWRLAPSRVTGSFLKVNFLDVNNQSIQEYPLRAEVRFSAPFEEFNYSFDFTAKNGQLVYLTMPYSTYETKIIITVKNSSDYILWESNNYWQTVNSSATFTYLEEKTFHIGSGQTPPTDDIINKPTESVPSNPVSEPTKKNVGGGQTVSLDNSGFSKSKKVSVYLDKKKIAETPLLSGNFGLKIDLPENIALGQHEVAIEGENGERAEQNIRVTSNKWFNNITYAAIIVFFSLLLLIYLIYRTIKHQRNSQIVIHSYQQ